MNKEQVLEGNKLIAEFMELGGFDDGRYGWMWHNPTTKNGSCFSLSYNTSWDWLMPVVKKIIAITMSSENGITAKLNVKYALETCEMDNIFKMVVGFIKYCNEHNKTV